MTSSEVDMDAMDLETARALCRRPKPPVPDADTNTQPELPESSDLSEFACRIPDELLLKVIELCLGDICISNDPEIDLPTIRSLAQTCRRVRQEILPLNVLPRRFKGRIHIYITNGKRCRCRALSKAKNIYKTPLGKALHPPPHSLYEVVIHFLPDVLRSARESCVMERSKMFRSWPKGTDLQVRDMKCAMDCITRQSQALGEMMAARSQTGRRLQEDIKFKFSFDGTRGVDGLNETRELPLWTTNLMLNPLIAWQWTSPATLSLPPIIVPRNITVGVEKRAVSALQVQLITGTAFQQMLTEAFELRFLRWWHDMSRLDWWTRFQHRDPAVLDLCGEIGDPSDENCYFVSCAIGLKEVMPD